MNKMVVGDDVLKAVRLAIEFIQEAECFRQALKNNEKESQTRASMMRRSMDLTRALSTLRRGNAVKWVPEGSAE